MRFKPAYTLLVVLVLFGQNCAVAQRSKSDVTPKTQSKLKLREWERGIAVESADQPGMVIYLWFYEWNMFGARQPGEHTHGTFKLKRHVSEDQHSASIEGPDLKLTMNSQPDAADLELKITNRSNDSWPDVAAIIPCFNPGAPEKDAAQNPLAKLNPQFNNHRTFFVGKSGLAGLEKRDIHFNDHYRPLLDRMVNKGLFVFSDKWPTSANNAFAGLIVRESTDRKWVTGIAWERFLSAQGNNPWQCMHLAVRVGPLKPEESRTVHGKIYLLPGTAAECFKHFQADFPKPDE